MDHVLPLAVLVSEHLLGSETRRRAPQNALNDVSTLLSLRAFVEVHHA